MKTVLIPWDLRPESAVLAARVAATTTEKLTIYLFHMFDMPDSLADVMIRRGKDSLYQSMTEELRQRCRKIKLQHPNIYHLSYRPMYGNTLAAFRNYADANEVDAVVWPDGYRFIPPGSESIDPEKFLLKSGLEVISDLTPLYPVTGTAHAGERKNHQPVYMQN